MYVNEPLTNYPEEEFVETNKYFTFDIPEPEVLEESVKSPAPRIADLEIDNVTQVVKRIVLENGIDVLNLLPTGSYMKHISNYGSQHIHCAVDEEGVSFIQANFAHIRSLPPAMGVFTLIHEIGHLRSPNFIESYQRSNELKHKIETEGLTLPEEVELQNNIIIAEQAANDFLLNNTQTFGLDPEKMKTIIKAQMLGYRFTALFRIGTAAYEVIDSPNEKPEEHIVRLTLGTDMEEYNLTQYMEQLEKINIAEISRKTSQLESIIGVAIA